MELLARYGRLCGEVESAAEYGMREERERELRVERDRLGVELLSRMARD